MSFPAKMIQYFFTLLVVTVPLIFLPNTSELFEFNKIIVTYILTLLIVTSWIARMIVEKRLIFRKSLLDWPLLIFLISQLLSLLFSIDPRTSLMGYYSRFNGGLLSLLCYSLLYWSAVSNLDHKSTKSIINWSLGSAAVVAAWGFLEHFGIDAHLWVQDVQNRVFSTLGQPNWLAAYLVALVFIPVSKLMPLTPQKSKVSRNNGFSWTSLSLSILLFLVLLYTKSRSGLLAFGICSALFWGINFLKLKSAVFKPMIIFILLTFTLTLAIQNPLRDLLIKSPPVVSNTSAGGTVLESGGTESGTIRKIVWTGAVRIWKSSSKNFWLGSGPETFAMAYYQFRPLQHNATSEWELLYNKAHNEFLNYLATTGLLGLISYLILLFTMIASMFKVQNNSDAKFLTFALLAGWISISITNFWGFSVVIVQIFLFLFPAFAITQNRDPDTIKPAPQSTWQYLTQLILYSSALLLLYSVCNYWLADVAYATGQKDFRAFNATQNPEYILSSYQNLSKAYQLNPVDSPISSDLGVTAAFMALLISPNDSTASSQLIEISNMASNRAINGSPYHPNYYKSRSRAMVVLGTMDPKYFAQSDESLAKAESISPTDPRIPYIRAINAKYDNHPDLAKKYLEDALKLKPDFADAKAQLLQLATPSATTN